MAQETAMNDYGQADLGHCTPSPLLWPICKQPRPLTAAPTSHAESLLASYGDEGRPDGHFMSQQSMVASMQQRPSSSGSPSMHIKLAALKLRRLEARRQQLFEDVEGWQDTGPESPLSASPARPNTCAGLESHSSMMRSLKSSAAMGSINRASLSGSLQAQSLTARKSLASALQGETSSSSMSMSMPRSIGSGNLGDEHTQILSRTDSVESDSIENSQPFDDPTAEMRTAIHLLNVAAAASRLDLDWQSQLQAISSARRLLRHHPEHVIAQLHPLLWGVAPAIDDLRSSVSKSALNFMMDAASILGHSLDSELESLLPLLVRKAGSASLGRDNFLAMHADKVLVVFMTSVSPLRFTGAVLAMTTQKGPKLRCKVASLLAACLDSHIGPRLVEHAPTAEKLLVAIMSLQKEGQLDTRMFAKQALARLKELLDSGGHSCATLVAKPGGKVDYAKCASGSPRVSGSPRLAASASKARIGSLRTTSDVANMRRCSSVPVGLKKVPKF